MAASYGAGVELSFSGEMFSWRGPAPYHFVALPPELAEDVREVAGQVSYGWGMIPVRGRVGDTAFTTAMWPKGGGYYVPVKDAVRRGEGLELGDEVSLELVIDGA